MKQTILKIARKVKHKCFPPSSVLTDSRLAKLSKSCEEFILENNIQPKLKVLWPTLFNQDHTWWAHDGVLICALRLRGIDVIPTMCDKLQSKQCMIHSGVWQRSYEPDFEQRRKELCNQCVNFDLRLWEVLRIKPLRLSNYVSLAEREKIWVEVNEIMAGDWERCSIDGYPVGNEARKAVLNNNLQGEIKPYWQQQANEMASHHIFNILALTNAYRKILSHVKPDRVFGNGGFYYQWGTLNHLCQQNNISYYRYYSIGLQPMSWNYSRNTNEILDLTPAWSSWVEQPWSESNEMQVKEDLKLRGLIVDSQHDVKIQIRLSEIRKKLNIDPSKKTLLALTGVIWDANTNIESASFSTMYEWLFESMEWFSVNPQFQLIIRVHPAENIAGTIAPEERTKFEKEMLARNIKVPSNVIIISPEEKIDSYDLMQLVDVGATYMSTTGIEFACLGKPLVAIGPVHYTKKGFTYEPDNKQAYFSMLQTLLENEVSIEKSKNDQVLAMKYWYLYSFHASVVTGLFESHQKNWLSIRRGINPFSFHPKLLKAQDLLPGKNKHLDYLCDAVINNLPIFDNNRWPPSLIENK